MPKKRVVFGKPAIVLEEDEKGFTWIYEENLFKPCEELFPEVQADPDHPLRGKRLIDAIAEDVEDKLGWEKYKGYLKRRGWL